MPTWLANKTLSTKFQTSFFGWQPLPKRVVTTCCWGNLVQTLWLHWERILWNLHLVSPRLRSTCLFPLLIAVCAICSNHSHEYDYTLTLMSSPIKSPSLEVILDNFNTAPYSLLLKVFRISHNCWVFIMYPSIFLNTGNIIMSKIQTVWKILLLRILDDSHPKLILSSMRHLVMSRDILDYHHWDSATGIKWVEARYIAKHPTI